MEEKMNKGLRIVYSPSPGQIDKVMSIQLHYNNEIIYEQFNMKDGILEKIQDISKGMSEMLLSYGKKYHSENIKRLIREALRKNDVGLRIEVLLYRKEKLFKGGMIAFYNGKLIFHTDYSEMDDFIYKVSVVGRGIETMVKRLKEKGITYHPANIKRLVDKAWRNKKIADYSTIEKTSIEIQKNNKRKLYGFNNNDTSKGI